MNYKIRITAENQAIVKRIADENGMNKYNYLFKNYGQFYIIINNKFDNIFLDKSDYSELTTEQFIQLFDKKETEWQPKRGDRVLVWDDSEDLAKESIFLCNIEKAQMPIFIVNKLYEREFLNNNVFSVACYKHMKPLPIEQPKETDFKSKVIELIEKEHQKSLELMDDAIYSKNYLDAHAYIFKSNVYKDLLNQIKQL
jgi:hypothetical protein